MSISIRLSPFAEIATLDGSPVITHSKSQASWKLDRPAFLVWRGIMQRRSLSGIQASLVHELEFSPPEAEQVVQHVIDMLRANELVVDRV